MSEKNEFNQIVGDLVENWSPAKRPPANVMRGNYCLLEPLDINKHAAELFDSLSIDNQGESWTYLPYGPFNTVDDFQDWLKKTMADKDTLLFVILSAKTQLPIGIAGYLRINPDHGVIEVGHLHFSKLLKRTPVSTEAMYLMMRHIFEELKYRRYEWKCHSLNQASCNAALRLGFKFEGIFRQSHVFKNRNRDTAWFSILGHEWPEIKEKFIKWLRPSNFNADGEQIVSLREI